jgi:hypothetical protein
MMECHQCPGQDFSANLSGTKITLDSSERAGHALKVLVTQGWPSTRSRILTKCA